MDYQSRASLDAELARARALQVGRVNVSLPEPLLPNGLGGGDEDLEMRRRAEYAALEARCRAEAAAWNEEAMRWAAERIDIAAEHFRIDASKLAHQHGGLLQAGERLSHDGDDDDDSECSYDMDMERDSDAEARESAERQSAAESVFSSIDAGLTVFSDLAAISQRHLDINGAVSEAHERVRWIHAVSERRRAIATLQQEQRSAFISRWLRKAADAAKEAEEPDRPHPPSAASSPPRREASATSSPASSSPDGKSQARSAALLEVT